MARDPYKYFRIEAQELTGALGKSVLALEKTATPELVAQLLRLAHTLKGAARVVKLANIADCAHGMEDALTPLRDMDAVNIKADASLINTLLKFLDEINAHIVLISSDEEKKQPATPAVPASPVFAEEIVRTVRIDV